MVLQPHLAWARASARAWRARAAAVCLLALVAACGKTAARVSPPDAGNRATGETEAGGGDRAEAEDDAGAIAAVPDDPPAADDEELYVDGVRLRLRPAECLLTARFLDEERRHRFEGFPGACHFAPDRGGQPWVVATEHGKAVLVQSWVARDADGCDTALQIVVITERGPELSREIQRVSGCGPGPWDELMYHVLASDRVPLGGG